MVKIGKPLTEALAELRRTPKFVSGPWYSRAGDCVFYYFEETESYGDRVDGILTVYRAIDGDQVVGCQIKGITALLRKFGEFGIKIKTKQVELAMLFLVSNLISEEDPAYSPPRRKALYEDLLTRVGEKAVSVA